MKKLFIKILIFLLLPLFLTVLAFLLPPNNKIKRSMLFAQIDKNYLLRNTPNPRIIFVGGSNLTLGLNCQIIKDSLNINPINTAIDAGIGIKYMLLNTLNYIRENDIIVLSPEYHQFYHNRANGEIELLYIISDVGASTKDIHFNQYLKMAQYLPSYISSKLKFWDNLKKDDTTVIGIFDRKSFNSFGDAYIHWNLPKKHFKTVREIDGKINESVFSFLTTFREMVYNKKAKIYITFPGYQDLSYNNSISQIKLIEERLNKNGFILLGTPERYKIPDSLMFDTSYHLTKKGVDFRTLLLIEDLKKVIHVKY